MATKLRMSFRSQLVLFGLLLVVIVALPSLIIEAQRPWEELNNQVDRGKIVISQVKSEINFFQLQKMNEFAFKINKEADPKLEKYLIWTFNLWFDFCENEDCIMVLTPEYMLGNLKAKKIETQDFDFEKLRQAENFWDKQFAANPEFRMDFLHLKEKLIFTKAAAKDAGFDFDDTYIMADNGQKLVFLLDGSSWYESSYPGLEYDVQKNDCPYFRDYLIKGPGFYTNPARYYLKIFPKFDTDAWGSWFSVWLAAKNNNRDLEFWNNFALDFNAGNVKALMVTIGIYILTILAVIALIITLLTSKLSELISKPINYLLAGTKAVIEANYEHIVPKAGSREFGEIIDNFNDMVVKLKGRVNLKQMLSRLLSKELAEKVEKEGMVLEGQEVEATIMFTDFAGFSTLTQNLEAVKIFKLLNEYFMVLDPIVHKWGGFTDKFVGDAIVAIFGAPVPLDNNAENAVCCAIEMQKKIRQFNEARKKEDKIIFEMRVGLYTGKVIAGALGSDRKIDYTSIGETTNLANRLETACDIGGILISEITFAKIKHIFFEGIDIDESPHHFEVKGYSEPIAAYNLYVANLKIEKNKGATGKDDFYLIKPADHRLKFFDKLSPEKKTKFSKVVKITPS